MWGVYTHLYFYSVGIAGLPGFPLRCWGSRIRFLCFHMKNFIDSVVSLFLPYSFRIDSVFVSLNLLPLLMYKLHPQCICVEENRAGCHLLFQAAAEGLRVCPLHLSDDGQTSNLTCFLKQDMDFFLLPHLPSMQRNWII